MKKCVIATFLVKKNDPKYSHMGTWAKPLEETNAMYEKNNLKLNGIPKMGLFNKKIAKIPPIEEFSTNWMW